MLLEAVDNSGEIRLKMVKKWVLVVRMVVKIMKITQRLLLLNEICYNGGGNYEISTKPTNYYNLDIIISVGYRVRFQRGVRYKI